jgi:hypothetical protein
MMLGANLVWVDNNDEKMGISSNSGVCIQLLLEDPPLLDILPLLFSDVAVLEVEQQILLLEDSVGVLACYLLEDGIVSVDGQGLLVDKPNHMVLID